MQWHSSRYAQLTISPTHSHNIASTLMSWLVAVTWRHSTINRARYQLYIRQRKMVMTNLERLRRNCPICKWGTMKDRKVVTWESRLTQMTRILSSFLWSKVEATCNIQIQITTTHKCQRHTQWKEQTKYKPTRSTILVSIRASTFQTILHPHHRPSSKIAKTSRVW